MRCSCRDMDLVRNEIARADVPRIIQLTADLAARLNSLEGHTTVSSSEVAPPTQNIVKQAASKLAANIASGNILPAVEQIRRSAPSVGNVARKAASQAITRGLLGKAPLRGGARRTAKNYRFKNRQTRSKQSLSS